MLKQCTIS